MDHGSRIQVQIRRLGLLFLDFLSCRPSELNPAFARRIVLAHMPQRPAKRFKGPNVTPRTTTSRLVQCPCCSRHVHTLLLDSHLERDCHPRMDNTEVSHLLGDLLTPPSSWPDDHTTTQPEHVSHILPASSSAPELSWHSRPASSSAQPPDAPPPPPSSGIADASATVRCPLCAVSLRNEDAFAHVEQCIGRDGGSTPAATAGSSSSIGCSQIVLFCPACDVACEGLARLNEHLDAGCPAPVGHAEAPAVAPTGASKVAAAARSSRAAGTHVSTAVTCDTAHLDRLAQELRCPLCFDLFNDPQALPCQHSFCKECLDQCFRVTSMMACPLCKAPMWRRQVMPNHTLANLKRVYQDLIATSSSSSDG